MTEAEWTTCKAPAPMLAFLRGSVSERKLRLVVVGRCRQTWNLLRDQGKAPAEVAELFADGFATPDELEQARWKADAEAVYQDMLHQQVQAEICNPNLSPEQEAALHRELTDRSNRLHAAMRAHMTTFRAWGLQDIALLGEAGCSLLRDAIGNPFRSAAADSACLAWNDGAIRKMSQSIYDARAFDRLPLLADALEDAGCTDADILSHCRSGGEHVRGCWVVDLLLGKE